MLTKVKKTNMSMCELIAMYTEEMNAYNEHMKEFKVLSIGDESMQNYMRKELESITFHVKEDNELFSFIHYEKDDTIELVTMYRINWN